MFGLNKLKMKKKELENENFILKETLKKVNGEKDGFYLKIQELTSTIRNQSNEIERLKGIIYHLEAEAKMKLYTDDSKNY